MRKTRTQLLIQDIHHFVLQNRNRLSNINNKMKMDTPSNFILTHRARSYGLVQHPSEIPLFFLSFSIYN